MFHFLRPPSQLRLSVGVRQNTRCRIRRDAIAENTGPRQHSETKQKKQTRALKGSAESQHNFTTVSVFRQSWHIHGNRLTPHFFCSQYISAPANYQAGVTLQE